MVKAVLDNRGVAEGRFALVRGRSARTDGVVARGLSRSTPSGWRGRSGRLDAGRSSLPARQRPRTVRAESWARQGFLADWLFQL